MGHNRQVNIPESLHQLRLGEFVSALALMDPDKPVFTDFGDALRGETQLFDCYVAHPSELAMSYRPAMRDDREQCVESILERASGAVGCTFIDHCGAEHTMTAAAPVWVANWCYATGVAVVGVDELPDMVVVRTWKIE